MLITNQIAWALQDQLDLLVGRVDTVEEKRQKGQDDDAPCSLIEPGGPYGLLPRYDQDLGGKRIVDLVEYEVLNRSARDTCSDERLGAILASVP